MARNLTASERRERERDVISSWAALTKTLGRPPFDPEVARRIGIGRDAVNRCRRRLIAEGRWPSDIPLPADAARSSALVAAERAARFRSWVLAAYRKLSREGCPATVVEVARAAGVSVAASRTHLARLRREGVIPPVDWKSYHVGRIGGDVEARGIIAELARVDPVATHAEIARRASDRLGRTVSSQKVARWMLAMGYARGRGWAASKKARKQAAASHKKNWSGRGSAA